MKSVRRFQDYLKGQLKNEEFRKSYEEESVYADLAGQIARIREHKGLSQKRLAQLLHTSPQMVSRLEDPQNASYSLKTLIKLARALGKELRIKFV